MSVLKLSVRILFEYLIPGVLVLIGIMLPFFLFSSNENYHLFLCRINYLSDNELIFGFALISVSIMLGILTYPFYEIARALTSLPKRYDGRIVALLEYGVMDGENVLTSEKLSQKYIDGKCKYEKGKTFSPEINRKDKRVYINRIIQTFYDIWAGVRTTDKEVNDYLEHFLFTANFASRVFAAGIVFVIFSSILLLNSLVPVICSTEVLMCSAFLVIALSLYAFRQYHLLWCRRTITVFFRTLRNSIDKRSRPSLGSPESGGCLYS